jgi:LmbE family N-acetylglucosaminyl deacetylase
MPPIHDVAELGTILSIWAHPDDETFQAGGIMAAASANGQRVVCVSATAGEHGTDDPVTWPPERLGRVRRMEAAASMAVLGVTDHRFLGLEDGTLAGLEAAEHVERVAELLDEVRPDTILTFGPDGSTFHTDHITISAWTRAAWEATGRRGRLFNYAFTDTHLERWQPMYDEMGVFMTDDRPVGIPEPDLGIRFDMDPIVLDRKLTALCAMHTQLAGLVAAVGRDTLAEESRIETYVEV